MHKSAENYAASFFNHTTRKICFTFKHLVDCAQVYKNLVEKKSNLLSVEVIKTHELHFIISYYENF